MQNTNTPFLLIVNKEYKHCLICLSLLQNKMKLYNLYSYDHFSVYFPVKPIADRMKYLQLKRDEFETLNIIGRGAFGEVGFLVRDDPFVILKGIKVSSAHNVYQA